MARRGVHGFQEQRRRRQAQAGIGLISIAVGAVILMLVATWGAGKIKDELDDAVAESTGTYMLSVKGGLDAFLSSTFDDIARADYDAVRAGTPAGPGGSGRPAYPSFRPSGTAADGSQEFTLAIEDLRTARNVPAAFPSRTPSGSAALVKIIRSGDATCPGTSCRIDGLAYTARPLSSGFGSKGDPNMIGQFLMSTEGYGLAAMIGEPAQLRGSTGSFANPVDSGTDGIVGVHSLLDTTMYEQFVRFRDRRDPDLQGDLTVAGTTTLNDVNVRGDLGVGDDGEGNNCIELRATGRVTVRCEGLLQAATGQFAGEAATVVDGVKGVTTKGVVDSDGGLRVQGTALTAVGEDQGVDLSLGGSATVAVRRQDGDDTRVESTQFNAQKVQLVYDGGPVRANQACTASQRGMLALTSQGAVAYCNDAGTSGMRWMEFIRVGTEGDPCGAETLSGALAQGSAGTLVCRAGFWRKLSDQYSALTLVGSRIVNNNDVVGKPVCGNLGSALIYLVPRAFESNRPAWNWYVENAGGQWTVRVNAPDWGASTGVPAVGQAIALMYCSYSY